MSDVAAVGVFDDPARAHSAVEALRRAGFPDDSIGIIHREDEPPKGDAARLADDPRSTGGLEAAGVGVGAAAGAASGLGTGLALATGLIPGVGPVITGGALVLLMAGSGAAVGSLVGGLIGLGVPQDEASRFESELAAGRSLVT